MNKWIVSKRVVNAFLHFQSPNLAPRNLIILNFQEQLSYSYVPNYFLWYVKLNSADMGHKFTFDNWSKVFEGIWNKSRAGKGIVWVVDAMMVIIFLKGCTMAKTPKIKQPCQFSKTNSRSSSTWFKFVACNLQRSP